MNDHRRPAFRFGTACERTAPIANGVLLGAFVTWVLCSNVSRDEIAGLESLAFSTQAAAPVQSGGVRVLVILVGAVLITLLTMLWGLLLGRRESRSIRSWLVFSFLVCGWLAAWLGRHDLYWYGHSVRVFAEVSAASQLADALDSNWPAEDGDHPQLGVVLAYPKGRPVTLLLAGEPAAVGRLRIVAVEKSDDGEILRFQLASPNDDTWLVRSKEGKDVAQFVTGLDTHYSSTRVRRLSRDWWLIRYRA